MLPEDCLGGRASAQARIRLLSGGMTADGVSVYLVDDHGTKVLQVSPANFPNMVREAVDKIQIARAVLGGTLASVIPATLDQWEIGGISCALFEAFKPLSPPPVKRFFQLNRISA